MTYFTLPGMAYTITITVHVYGQMLLGLPWFTRLGMRYAEPIPTRVNPIVNTSPFLLTHVFLGNAHAKKKQDIKYCFFTEYCFIILLADTFLLKQGPLPEPGREISARFGGRWKPTWKYSIGHFCGLESFHPFHLASIWLLTRRVRLDFSCIQSNLESLSGVNWRVALFNKTRPWWQSPEGAFGDKKVLESKSWRKAHRIKASCQMFRLRKDARQHLRDRIDEAPKAGRSSMSTARRDKQHLRFWKENQWKFMSKIYPLHHGSIAIFSSNLCWVSSKRGSVANFESWICSVSHLNPGMRSGVCWSPSREWLLFWSVCSKHSKPVFLSNLLTRSKKTHTEIKRDILSISNCNIKCIL